MLPNFSLSDKTKFDLCHAVCNFARYELDATKGGFMVKQNAAGRMHAKAFTIIYSDPMPIELGDSVRRAGIERGRFGLYGLCTLPNISEEDA